MELIPDNLVALPLGRLKDVVVASPALLAREGIPATPYELGGRSCLLQGHNPDWEQWHFRQGEEEAHILVQGECGPTTTAPCCNWPGRAWALPSVH